MKIIGYEFEVIKGENENGEFIKKDLSSALEIISSDGWLRALYNLQIEDRITGVNKIDLPYKAIAQLNEQQIIDLVEQEIKIKHKEEEKQ